VVADAPRVSRCKHLEEILHEDKRTKHGHVALPLLVCIIGRGKESRVCFATDISAQKSTRRCLEDLEESDKNACLISQPRMKKQNIMPLMHVQLCRPILLHSFQWLICSLSATWLSP
jgi:hypothetical protein